MYGESFPLPIDPTPGWWPLDEMLVERGNVVPIGTPIYTFKSQFAPDKKAGVFSSDDDSSRASTTAAADIGFLRGLDLDELMAGIYAFVSQFVPDAKPGLLSTSSGEHRNRASSTVAADVDFLTGLDLKGLMASGAADAPLQRLMVSPAVAAAGEASEGKHPAYDENNLPTPATIVADLKATANFKSAIADLNDDGRSGPLPYLGKYVFDCADEVHEDETKQYVFSTPEDVEEVIGGDRELDDDQWREIVFRSRAQLAALKQYSLAQRVFFVLIHTDRFVEGDEQCMSSDVLLMALGVSVVTGNLVGVIAIQACHNLCD